MAYGKAAFKYIYKAHTYIGLFVAIHFAIFSLTGLLLLFKDEVQSEKIEQEKKWTAEEISTAYFSALEKAKLEFPQDKPLAIYPDDNNKNILHIRMGIDGSTKLRGSRRLKYNLQTGEKITHEETSVSGFYDAILILHRELFLGSNGKLYVGFVGFLYVLMLVSGFFIYGRFMKSRTFGEIRKAKIPKLVDLHKFVGVVTFGWGLIIGLSGVFLAFNGLLIKIFQMQSLKHLSEQYSGYIASSNESASLANIIRSVFSEKIDSEISYISFPNTEYGIQGHYLILVDSTQAFAQKLSELFVVNNQTAQIAEIVQLPLYLKLVLLSEPLHFGDYGGLFLKIVWAIFTLCSLAVVLFGVYSFYLKRKNRKVNVEKTTDTIRKNSKSKKKEIIYKKPILVGSFSILGIVGALFLEGFLDYIAVGLLLIPLVVLFVRRRNA
ncbi:MAG: PepSY domain-containing protein [Oligoflexia bacterium]|nr:PepSY domain-containing protein [Oligoflexia bacterium]